MLAIRSAATVSTEKQLASSAKAVTDHFGGGEDLFATGFRESEFDFGTSLEVARHAFVKIVVRRGQSAFLREEFRSHFLKVPFDGAQ